MKTPVRVHGHIHGPGGPDPTPGTSHGLLVVVDGLGNPIATGVKGDSVIDFQAVIKGWTLVADVTGDVEIDIWKSDFASFPPTSGGSITGTNPPTLIGQSSARDTVLDGWTTTVNAGDVLRFNVDSASAVTQVTLALYLYPF